MREIDMIIIHCSATPPNMDIGADKIREWHVDGNGWRDIGYHFVIRRDGSVEDGRPIDQSGVHTRGYNTNSIGICMVGGVDKKGKPDDNFTLDQWRSLRRVLISLKADYKNATIHGHNEFDSGKACPSFNVQDELTNGRLIRI